MRRAPFVAALLFGALFLAGNAFPQAPEVIGDRNFVLVMKGHQFNGFSHPDTPLLEAYLGEQLNFHVAVPPLVAEPHVFHLHGHPWLDAAEGRVIDAKFLRAGETTSFSVTAGGTGGFTGDWMYHCHMDAHFAGGMWGVLRVYPYSIVPIPGLDVPIGLELHRLGAPVEGATFTLTVDGTEVPLTSHSVGAGRYALQPAMELREGSTFVVESNHALGTSILRGVVEGGNLVAQPDSLPRPPVEGLEVTDLKAHADHGVA